MPIHGTEISVSTEVAHRHSRRAKRCTTALDSSLPNDRNEVTLACCTIEEMHSQTEVVRYRAFSTSSLPSESSSARDAVAAANSAIEKSRVIE